MEIQSDVRQLGWARDVLATSSWTLLVLVVLGILASMPPFADRAGQVAPGSLLDRVGTGIAVVGSVAMLGAWFGAISHAAVVPYRRTVSRPLALGILLVGNFVAAFFYYFLIARRNP